MKRFDDWSEDELRAAMQAGHQRFLNALMDESLLAPWMELDVLFRKDARKLCYEIEERLGLPFDVAAIRELLGYKSDNNTVGSVNTAIRDGIITNNDGVLNITRYGRYLMNCAEDGEPVCTGTAAVLENE